MNLILEFDDFNPHPEVDCLAEIKAFVRVFPEIKLTMFTPALYKDTPLYSNPTWCDEVRKLIKSDNLRLAVHGCYHTNEEFKNIDYQDAIRTIVRAESIFRVAALPFIRCFRGPHWGINQSTYNALKWLDYTHVYTHEDYKELADANQDVTNVIYDWNLSGLYIPPRKKDVFGFSDGFQVIVGHGHTHNVCGNGIQESSARIDDFIRTYTPKFNFADEI